MPPDSNSWTQYQRLVLAELERHGECLEKLEMHLNKLEVELATLKVRAGVWGLMGGAIPVVVAILIELLKK